MGLGVLAPIIVAFASPAPADRPVSPHLSLGGVALEACNAVFLSGMHASQFLENSSLFWLGKGAHITVRPVVDLPNRQVTTETEDAARSAIYTPGQGCTLATTTPPLTSFPPAARQPPDWMLASVRLPKDAKRQIDRALALAFSNSRARTSAVLIVHDGRIVAESYAPGVTMRTPLAGWSMTKTVQAALVGVLAHEGAIRLRDPVPIDEWRSDVRRTIRWIDLMRMSSGLDCSDGRDYDQDRWRAEGYPDHLAALIQDDSFAWAVARPAAFAPGRVGRYRNCDAVALGAAIDRVLAHNGRHFASWSRDALYERIGMPSMSVSTDARGNPIMAGFGYATARDWGRFGQFLLQDGVWKGQRLLDRDFMDMLRAPAPAWVGAGMPHYAGQVWLERSRLGQEWVPEDTYALRGIDGQAMWIIPSLDLVVLRLGFGGRSAPGESPIFSMVEDQFLREIVTAFASSASHAQEAPIRATLKGYFEALERGDRERAERLTTNDFLLYDAGQVMDNAELFRHLDMSRHTFSERRWILSNIVVEAGDRTATIRYRNEGWRLSKDGSVQSPQWLESAHLVREAGAWKLRFLHSSRRN